MQNSELVNKILIVEDEAIIARDISSRLTRLGFIVIGTANCCEDALEIINKGRPDIVLMDIVIKGEHDGIESAHIINEKYSIPVVYLTAHSDSYTIERTKFTNPYGFISKPVDDNDLSINIRNALYRHDAETKLRDFKEKYYRLAENSKDIIFRYSYFEKKFDFINEACTAITGYSPNDFYDNENLFNVYFKTGEIDNAVESSINIDFEYPIVNKENKRKWVKLSAIALKDSNGTPYALEGILYDVTEKALYEQMLRDTNEKLHALAEHLDSVRENERLEVSHELHDRFGQDLTGLKLTLSLLLKKIAAKDSHIDRELFDNELNIAVGKIDELFTNIRKFGSDLRPDMLERLGLIDAVNWQIEGFKSKSDLSFKASVSGNDSALDKKTSLGIYRILQELLTNIVRHSLASEAEVTLEISDSKAVLVVKDNGRGIAKAKLVDAGSIGIFGIRERVYRFGGEISFVTAENSGTECRVVIPIK